MDKKVANNLIVGIIVAVGFFGFVFILFNIGGGMGVLTSQYTLLGKFKDVKGVHTGSEISLAGLRIGVVKSITVSKDDSKELVIELGISKSLKERIRKDSVALIRTQGVLGDKYVEVTIGTNSEPMLEDGSFIKTEEPEDLFSRGGTLVEDISKQFNEGGELKETLKNLNILVKNLNTLTTDVKHHKGLLNAAIYGTGGPKLDASMASLEQIMKKIEKGEGTLGSLINDPTVYEDLKSLLGGAKRSNVLKYFMRSFIEDGEKGEEKKEPKK
jgi:phospholipid/cholesterol/gamma-HCH transport system substrate-binding protein